MTQRFGRNKRRKLNMQIAALLLEKADLVTAHHMDRSLMRDMSNRMDAMRDQLERTAELLGPHFAGLAPKPRLTTGHGVHALPLYEPHNATPYSAMDDWQLMRSVGEKLELVEMLPKKELDAFRAMVHISLRNADGKLVGYAISPAALLSLPRADAVRMLTTNLAQVMLRLLRTETRP